MANDYYRSALFEHRFWLQVLGDHARFILTSLAPTEVENIRKAQYFIHVFDELLAWSRREIPQEELALLNQKAYRHTLELRDFKLHLIRQHLSGKIQISLTPTFINHMVNELEEYLRILTYLNASQDPPAFDEVHHHLLWLLDASGHAAAITSNLDQTEKLMKAKSKQFGKHFEDFYLKAVEMAGFMRTHLRHFPALSRFNKQVEWEMLMFMQFLNELEEMELDSSVLSILSPLMADHMAREECYYLMKLAQVSEVNAPQCDPTKPRVER